MYISTFLSFKNIMESFLFIFLLTSPAVSTQHMLCITGSITFIPVTIRLCANMCVYLCVCVCMCVFLSSCTRIDKSGPQDARRAQKHASHVKRSKYTMTAYFTVQTIWMPLPGPNVCCFYSHLISNQTQTVYCDDKEMFNYRCSESQTSWTRRTRQ